MSISYDENVTNTDDIIHDVCEIGYGASLHGKEASSKSKNELSVNNDDEIKYMKKRLIISFCFLIPLMYIAMYHMFDGFLGIKTPDFYNESISWKQKCDNIFFYSIFNCFTNNVYE